jgi:hypothetical protein
MMTDDDEPPARKRLGWFGGFIIACVAIAIFAKIGEHQPAATTPAAQASPNAINHNIASLSPREQAEKPGNMVRLFGDPCTGRSAFYMGATTDHDAFWSVKCSNGQSYAVEIKPDGAGTILECPQLEAIHAGRCFTKFQPFRPE